MENATTNLGAQPPADQADQTRHVPPETLDSLTTVLEVVRRGRANSRAEVAERTGLSRAVVAQRVSELLGHGLLVEDAMGPSTGGRPPRRLEFRADAGFLLVADIGATSIDAAVTDLAGGILAHYAEPADVSAGPDVILGRVDEILGTILKTASPSGRLWGMGIGVPGPVEFRIGRPISPPIMPGWDHYPVRERFTDRYCVPVWTDNDVNVMALGELRAGVAVGHQHVVFVKIGTGIGAGIIANGVVHRGAQGSAGDIGHIQVTEDSSVVCRCGKIGCLEAVAAGASIAAEALALARGGQSRILAEIAAEAGTLMVEDVSRAAAFGDAQSIQLLQRSGRLVGRTLAGIVNFFNPSLLVIGGGVSRSSDDYLAAIREAVYARSLPLATRDLQVKRSALGGLAGVIGAAAMVVDQLFSREHLGEWIATGRPEDTALRLLAG